MSEVTSISTRFLDSSPLMSRRIKAEQQAYIDQVYAEAEARNMELQAITAQQNLEFQKRFERNPAITQSNSK